MKYCKIFWLTVLNVSVTVILFSFSTIKAHGQDLKHLRRFGQILPTPDNAIPYGNNLEAGHYLLSGDAKIYYEIYGKGNPLVLLHGGLFGSLFEMGEFIDSLSKHYQVIAISTRGHGKSEAGSVEPSYQQKAEDVNNIVDAVTKSPVVVLGFSDGAYTSYYFAGKYPKKVKQMVAIGAGVRYPGTIVDMNLKKASGLDSLYWKQQLALNPHPENMDAWFSSVSKYYSSFSVNKDVFSKVKSPVLLISGELDLNAPLGTVIAAYHMLPNAQLGIIPNAPHPAFQVNFPAIWADIVNFLNL